MRTVDAIARAPSSAVTDRPVSVFRYSWQQILVQVRFTWPRKTAEQLSSVTGSSVRTCYRWLAGVTEPDAPEALAILSALRDEHDRRGRLLQQFELQF
jgi:hypothetical protein